MPSKQSPMDKDTEKKLEVFRKNVTNAGEEVVFRTFPNKILELDAFLQTTLSPQSPFHISHAQDSTDATVYPASSHTAPDEPQTKKRKFTNGVADEGCAGTTLKDHRNDTQHARFPGKVMANDHLPKNVHKTVKKECEQLATSIDRVKLWVTLTMPKIEDGDNFGVQIQEEVLSELHRAQESAFNLRDAARQDYLARAEICSKLIKYPNVEDYTLALEEHDERQLYLARQHLYDIRNMYAVLTDLIHKNISKIRVPKANNSIGLY